MKETKVYVDELPKNCYECPCFKNDLELPCGLSDGTEDYFKDEIDGGCCPLQSLKTHDREFVKEVCEKIARNVRVRKIQEEWYVIETDLRAILDKIQKEFEDE